MTRSDSPAYLSVLNVASFVLMIVLSGHAQQTAKMPALDSLKDSHIRSIKTVGVTDTGKTIVRLVVRETGNPGAAIQGATVLLRRDKDKMLGRVTKQDGRCNFSPQPAAYDFRVQLTGYKTLDTFGSQFDPGKVYEVEIRMARN